MSALWLLLALALILVFWHDSLRARERARKVSAEVCRRQGVQLLDDTVALSRLGLARDAGGRARLERRYVFEFSATGRSRARGTLVMLGQVVEVVHLEAEEHPGAD